MRDEQPVPETLESIAASLREFRKSMDARFDTVDERFSKVDVRFDTVDERFSKVDARFDTVDERFSKVDARFDTVDERLSKVDARFEKVDERFGTVDAQSTSIMARFDNVDSRFDEMKAQLRTEIESVRGDVRLVAEGFAAQRILLERIDNNHRRLEERVDKHDLRILALEPKKPA